MKRAIILTLLLCVLPIMGLVKTEVSWFWLVTTFFASLCVILFNVVFQNKRYRIPATIVVAATIHAINSAYFFSFLLQSEGFNSAFFYHLSPDVLFGAIGDYIYLLIAEIFHWILLIITALMVGRKAHANEFLLHHKVGVVLVTIFSVGIWTPAISIYSYMSEYVFENTTDSTSASLILKKIKNEPFYISSGIKKNLVFIYLEGVERAYFQLPQHKNLMPKLTKIKDSSFDFSNMTQVKGTGFTIGGLVASQCGMLLVSPYTSTDHNNFAPEKDFMKEAKCLGDLLKDQGYSQDFIGGADLRFAGKGKFFSSHGYDQVNGKIELLPQLEDKKYIQGWGLWDDTLFGIAWSRFNELSKGKQPFSLTTLTVDTHPPHGNRSKTCNRYEGSENSMLDSVHCADQLVSEFIEKIRNSIHSENTVIVVMSDHLAMHNDASSILKNAGVERKLTFFINHHDSRSRLMQNQGTHFDVTPTVLDAMDFKQKGQFAFGQSLIKSEAGFLYQYAKDVDVINNSLLQDYVTSQWQKKPAYVTSSGLELVPFSSNKNGSNGHILHLAGKEYNLTFQGYWDTSETVIKIDPVTHEIIDYKSYYGDFSKFKDGDLARIVLQDPYKDYIIIGRNKYLGGLVDSKQPKKISIFVGSPSSTKYLYADIDRKSFKMTQKDLSDIFASPKTEKMYYIRKSGVTPTSHLLLEERLGLWFPDHSKEFSVTACGYGRCSSEIISGGNQTSVKRGLGVYGIDRHHKVDLISHMDYCGRRHAYVEAKPLAELIKLKRKKYRQFLLVSNDTVHCSSKREKIVGLGEWLGEMKLPHLQNIPFRRPYLALVNLDTSEVLELPGLFDYKNNINITINDAGTNIFGN